MRLALIPLVVALLAAGARAQPPPVMEIPAPLDALLRQTRAQVDARLADALTTGVPEEDLPDQEALADELDRLEAELKEVGPDGEPSEDLLRRIGAYDEAQMKAYLQGDQGQASDLRLLLSALDEIEDSARRGARPDPDLLKFSSPESPSQRHRVVRRRPGAEREPGGAVALDPAPALRRRA